MAAFLRMVRCHRWDIEGNPWLGEGEVPAGAFIDLKTDKNALSVWRFDGDQSTLDRLVAALAANREKLDHFEYALANEEAIPTIKVQQTPGESPDQTIAFKKKIYNSRHSFRA
jgi:hypothetical protein